MLIYVGNTSIGDWSKRRSKLWTNCILVYENLSTFESYGIRFCSVNFRTFIKTNGLACTEKISPAFCLIFCFSFNGIYPLRHVPHNMQDLSRACRSTVAIDTKKRLWSLLMFTAASCGLDHSVRIFNVAVLVWLAVLLSLNSTAYIKCKRLSLDQTAPTVWRTLQGRCGFSWR